MAHEPPNGSIVGLPDNARRPLEPGERYRPVVPDESGVFEVTVRSVVLGLAFCALFAMAAAYLALKVGQGIEAAIPISILAIGLSRFFPRRSTLLENVIIQSIGANSSHVVSGAVFTIPALYMLAAIPGSGVVEPTVWQIIVVSFLGGSLGVLFLIPLRYHFMVEMHGRFPWPEATATTEIILSGERVGNQAKLLAVAAGLGALYDGLVTSFHAMAETIEFKSVWLGDKLTEYFMTLRVLNNAAIVGIGYIVGLRYAAIICAGSFLSYLVLVPLVHAIGAHVDGVLPPGALPIAEMTPDQVFKSYVRIIGVGGIAGAGILGILSSLPSMIRSIGANLVGMRSQDTRVREEVPRVDQSLTGRFTAVGLLVFAVATFTFFSFGIGLESAFLYALVGTALVSVIAFLFAPVAARAIAIVGTNPVSGMTMLTLIVTGLVLLEMGLTGGSGMFVTMMVGGVVCTALAASGALASDLKVGHWIGATPAKQLGLKFLGTLVAALFCGVAMWVMAQAAQHGSADAWAPTEDAALAAARPLACEAAGGGGDACVAEEDGWRFLHHCVEAPSAEAPEGAAGYRCTVAADHGDGFGSRAIPAPQASAMKEILLGIFGTASAPLQWYLFALGVLLALILRVSGVPPLAFALGMYLPMELNTPVLLGGILSWFVLRRRPGDSDTTVKAREDRGVLLASGLMAGGAILGVLDAVVNAVIKGTTGGLDAKEVVHILPEHAFEGATGELVAIAGLAALCVFIVTYSRRAR